MTVHGQGMNTVAQIIEYVGGNKAAASLMAVEPDVVRAYVRKGELPASWYDALERATGRPLPRHLFTFKAAAKGDAA